MNSRHDSVGLVGNPMEKPDGDILVLPSIGKNPYYHSGAGHARRKEGVVFTSCCI